jgi:hypothetical protein
VFAFSGSSQSLRAAAEVVDSTTAVPLGILPAT